MPEPPQPSTAPVAPGATTRTVRLTGKVPVELWNRLGTKILPKLRSGSDLSIGVDFAVTVRADAAASMIAELRQILQDLSLGDDVRIE